REDEEAAPAVDAIEGTGDRELALGGQALDVGEVAPEHLVALRTVRERRRAGLEDHQHVSPHALRVGAHRLGQRLVVGGWTVGRGESGRSEAELRDQDGEETSVAHLVSPFCRPCYTSPMAPFLTDRLASRNGLPSPRAARRPVSCSPSSRCSPRSSTSEESPCSMRRLCPK